MMNCGGNYCGKKHSSLSSVVLSSRHVSSNWGGDGGESASTAQYPFQRFTDKGHICSRKSSWLKMHHPSPKTLIPVLQPYWPNRSCTSQLAYIAARRPFWLRHDEVLPKMLEKHVVFMLAQLVSFICRGAQMKKHWPTALQFVLFFL